MNVLITAGPTHEPIDPVRFISNHSSGKMGLAIAEEFARIGWSVTLVKGPTSVNPANPLIHVVPVQTAAEMFDACSQYFDQNDVIVFAAAVADYTPAHPSSIKIKKKEGNLLLELVKTRDIAMELGKRKREQQFTVGFALETNDELENAKGKLKRKNLDFIVLNSMNDKGAGFQYDTNKISIIDNEQNVINFGLKLKTEAAKDIVTYLLQAVQRKTNAGHLTKPVE